LVGSRSRAPDLIAGQRRGPRRGSSAAGGGVAGGVVRSDSSVSRGVDESEIEASRGVLLRKRGVSYEIGQQRLDVDSPAVDCSMVRASAGQYGSLLSLSWTESPSAAHRWAGCPVTVAGFAVGGPRRRARGAQDRRPFGEVFLGEASRVSGPGFDRVDDRGHRGLFRDPGLLDEAVDVLEPSRRVSRRSLRPRGGSGGLQHLGRVLAVGDDHVLRVSGAGGELAEGAISRFLARGIGVGGHDRVGLTAPI
jgi:hypothetical protein